MNTKLAEAINVLKTLPRELQDAISSDIIELENRTHSLLTTKQEAEVLDILAKPPTYATAERVAEVLTQQY
jgi:predicted metal-dependent hydrolase